MKLSSFSVADFHSGPSQNWRRLRLKHLLREIDARAAGQSLDLLGLSKEKGVLRRSEIEQRASEAANYEAYKMVLMGDLISNKMQAWNGVFGISPFDGVTSPDYAIYRFNSTCDPRFVERVLRTPLYAMEFLARSRGIGTGFMRLHPDAFLDTPVWLPDIATQKAIAAFLDAETARVDALIEKKQLFLEKNEARFEAFISVAVTRGLDAPAKMKASGHEWEPVIPAHWLATRLKFLCLEISDCLHETPTHVEDGKYPSIRTADVRRGSVDVARAKRVTKEEYHHRVQRLKPRGGDILYSREGERYGIAALVPQDAELCLGQRMMLFRPNCRIVPAYLMWSMNAQFAYNILKRTTFGATSPHLNIFDIKNTPIFLPPEEEQNAIVRSITTRFKKRGLSPRDSMSPSRNCASSAPP